ncbi:sensor histidine kinase [Rhizobium leguminosarum bv. viciae]|uniref:sensor histidine kinase n=1 Tax=Rhizobium leguminosarum TaxID=384 RepID=UPI00144141BE|nr:sensor histidine kinase [Rhizobium leguminosarum]NKK01168.1 sensor histidine kinase [Rhizobium leguminosarum bv. viciae]
MLGENVKSLGKGAWQAIRLLGASLRIQLLAWIFLTLIGAICINLYLSFLTANATANLILDQTLMASARVIAEDVTVDESGAAQIDIPPAALEMFDTGFQDRVFYRVITAWGNLVAGFPDLTESTRPGIGEEAVFHDSPVRLLTLYHPLVGLKQQGDIAVTVAATRNGWTAMRDRLWLSDFSKQLVLVLLAGTVTIVGLQRGLAPVLRLRDAVRDRGRERLDPLSLDIVQTELRPLVATLNDHMERVQNQIAAQRRFVANAAHQLRTPLALIAMQASVAAREADPARREEALQSLRTSTRLMTRLASQLLTLSRAEPGSRRPRSDRIDFAATVRQILEYHAEEALGRGMDLGLEADEQPIFVEGDGTMLREMVVNLVDNALRYTPRGGTVTVRTTREGDEAVLQIEDSGPGIPEGERDHVFERFYRIVGTQAEGSGLGLAIVREVVTGAGGNVTLRDATTGGLLLTVRIPAVGP